MGLRNMTRFIFKIITVIILLAFSDFIAFASEKELYFIDAHSQMDVRVSQDTIIELMDNNGVYRTILTSRRGRKPKEIIEFSEAFPERIIPSLATKQFGYISKSEKKHKKYYKVLNKLSSSGKFRAMAEVLMWHSGCPNNRCPSVRVEATDKRVRKALEAATTNNWPFIPHIEFGSLYGSERAEFMNGLKSMLETYPSHPFALIHMGQLNSSEVRKLINKHKNIYFLTAHTNPIAVDNARGAKPWIDMYEGKILAPKWKKLVIDHSDRFVFAMDNVWGDMHWKPGLYNGQIALWRQALSDLPEDVAHAVAHGNAERLWNIHPRN